MCTAPPPPEVGFKLARAVMMDGGCMEDEWRMDDC
jgi:hypothetical protein